MTGAQHHLSIDGRGIRQGGRPFLIAEVAQAHDGSLGFAHAFIEVAASAGVDCIKFQTHIAEAESTHDEAFRVAFSREDATRYDYWKRMEFTPEQWAGLAAHAREKNLVFLSSCFSPEAVAMMRAIGMPAWKVGSGEVDTPDLRDAMFEGGEPILLSSGMSGYDEMARHVDRVKAAGAPFGLFQCTTRYPTRYEDVGLNVIDVLHSRFGCPVGLSDHSGEIWPSVAAMARGAAMIEVHVALHKLQFGPDTVASLDPAALRQLVEARDAIDRMTANPVDKDATGVELAGVRALFGKSIALKRSLPAGSVLTRDDLAYKKPGGGIAPERLAELIGRTLARDVSAERLLLDDDLHP
jgi:N,N'-diacetyllegionaminate synthase